MKIDPATWAKLTKSQKRSARKKIAAERLSLAIRASDRRDADFVARLTGKSKGSCVMSFTPTKQQKECTRVLTTCINSASVTDKSKIRNANWNAAQSLASLKKFDSDGNQVEAYNTVFVLPVRKVHENSERVLLGSDTAETKADFVAQSKAARLQAENMFSELRHVFDGSMNAVIDTLHGELARVETAITSAKLAFDEAVKSGKKPEIAKAEKDLAFHQSRKEKIENRIDSLTEEAFSISTDDLGC